MHCPQCPTAAQNRLTARQRRGILYGALATVALCVALCWLIVACFMLPGRGDGDRASRNPIQMVKDWLFPPPQIIFVDEFSAVIGEIAVDRPPVIWEVQPGQADPERDAVDDAAPERRDP